MGHGLEAISNVNFVQTLKAYRLPSIHVNDTEIFPGSAFLNRRMSGLNRVVGVKFKNPTGIVTIDDIVGLILQKDQSTQRSRTPSESENTVPVPAINFTNRSTSGMRQRIVSKGKPIPALDGAHDTEHTQTSRSSYTVNSEGGFHGYQGSTSSRAPTVDCSITLGDQYAKISRFMACSSLPTRKGRSTSSGPEPPWSRRYVSAGPVLIPELSRQRYTSMAEAVNDSSYELIMPKPSSRTGSEIDHDHNISVGTVMSSKRELKYSDIPDGETVSLCSSSSTVRQAYDGFPLDLLSNAAAIGSFSSCTLPRAGTVGFPLILL